VLRAGPLSDERVIRLINRRFVPFYFDLSDSGVMADPDARRFVVKANRRLGGRGVPTPNLMIMTPEGEVVTEVSNYGTTAQVLRGLVHALERKPDYDQPSQMEKEHTEDIIAAQIRIDLLDDDGARHVLDKVIARSDTPTRVCDGAHYLLGRIARLDRDFATMEGHFNRVKDKDLADDIRMERAYPFWYAKEYQELRAHLAQFPKNSPRYSEAQYYLGLALFHLGDSKTARKTWASAIKSCSQDPWIYRADWAYVTSKEKGRTAFSSAARRTSLLNRIGYMGRANPDLSGPHDTVRIRREAGPGPKPEGSPAQRGRR